MTYAEKLQDPRWHELRLFKLGLSAYRCDQCSAEDIELHVHHKRYIGGREPWEYNADDLETLCIYCHEKEHGIERYNKPVHILEILKDVIFEMV